ncbi:conserved hypothetical protein [Vibrio crassostreae]|nr:conserved hypothetical protein [Vibrio crassostreae]
MARLIHYPYFYHFTITKRAEENLRQRYKENDLCFEYATFRVMVTPLLNSLGIKAEGDLNSSYSDHSASRIAALVTEMLWNDMRANNIRYLSP